MTVRWIAILLAAATLAAQTDAPTGSLSGVVKNSLTGAPIPMIRITAIGAKRPDGGNAPLFGMTDAKGHYSIKGIPAGKVRLHFQDLSGTGMGAAPFGEINANVISGQDVTVDHQLPKFGPTTIRGRVVDQNREPVSGIEVDLIAREYDLGALRYVITGGAVTDDQGSYTLGPIRPGRSYLIAAYHPLHDGPAISTVPADAEMRKAAWAPVWYPGSPGPEGAQAVEAAAGTEWEAGDLQIRRANSYCASGVASAGAGPARLHIEIVERAFVGDGVMGMFQAVRPHAARITAADGKFRICDLHPGDYQLTVFSDPPAGAGPLRQPSSNRGEMLVTVSDHDVERIEAVAQSKVSFAGETAWYGPPPDASAMKERLTLMPRTVGAVAFQNVQTTIPGRFEMSLAREDIRLLIPVPDGAYIKDVTFGGAGIRNKPLHPAEDPTGQGLRIVFGMDGGTIAVKVTDKDGNAVDNAPILIAPDGLASEAELAEALVTGSADDEGAWKSPPLEPGKYWVLSVLLPDKSPETIAKLIRARGQAKEVTVGPGGSASAALMPAVLTDR